MCQFYSLLESDDRGIRLSGEKCFIIIRYGNRTILSNNLFFSFREETLLPQPQNSVLSNPDRYCIDSTGQRDRLLPAFPQIGSCSGHGRKKQVIKRPVGMNSSIWANYTRGEEQKVGNDRPLLAYFLSRYFSTRANDHYDRDYSFARVHWSLPPIVLQSRRVLTGRRGGKRWKK